jgi:hypothetical protein
MFLLARLLRRDLVERLGAEQSLAANGAFFDEDILGDKGLAATMARNVALDAPHSTGTAGGTDFNGNRAHNARLLEIRR